MTTDTYHRKYKDLAAGNIFQTLRILVIGRPGAGKSTLIKLILGLGEGPESRDGKAGVQDISKEWSHPTLPLKIHESDIDYDSGDGSKPGFLKRLLTVRKNHHDPDAVKDFLKTRQKKSDFAQHIHLVWYVVSALDDRNKDNARVLTEIGKYDLPILLIVTHADQDPEGVKYAENVDKHLDELLHHVRSKGIVIKNMTKVSNDVMSDPSRVDDAALAKLSEKTKEHLQSEELKQAWAAAQAVDITDKISLTAREIVGYKEAAIYLSPTGLIPGTHQTIMGSLLVGLCRALCQIWAVPKPFKKSLRSNLASEEVFQKQLSLLMQKLMATTQMGVGGAVGAGPLAATAVKVTTPIAGKVLTSAAVASISESLALTITPVALAAAAVGWIYASRNDAYEAMLAMVSLGMMTTGAILYVKAAYDPRGWNANRPRQEYDGFIKEFVSIHGPDLKQSIENRHSVSDVFSPSKDKEQIILQLTTYFNTIFIEHKE